ncbi:MAG: aminodeoxychorismate/anthranilate synthase component II [Chloroflexi bacterium]|nr:aminodeoxychorismate/anthranilate synthase component II [Chloroflexota bacterium]MBA3851561.1 aminodeoxychorismate/anthranilate synthase component II [Chloroflexota bacterium]MDQ3407082.1 aminodeoxychorismate/anthranilate synthase component II [Chloroflexota bacterium]
MTRILLLDNYDSFTWNLYQLLSTQGVGVEVVRNDETSVETIAAEPPDAIVISPGPSRPERAGISVELIRQLGPTIPTLGVCLGHQAIGVAYGGEVVRVEPVHGKRSPVLHEGGGLFDGAPSPLSAARYHSLAIERSGLPKELELTAWSPDGLVMGVRHRTHPVEGIQFHPESILTDDGPSLISRWLSKAVGPDEVRATY